MEWNGLEWRAISCRPIGNAPCTDCVCLMRVLPSCAEVVVFDGRLTPHGTWVSPRANSTQWPFFGVALIVQSRAM